MDEAGHSSKLLVIANETIAGRALHAKIRAMLAENGKVLVVAPALSSRLKYAFSDVDGPRAQAQLRLDETLEAMRREGIEADGEIGDSSPVRAFEDFVAVFEPDAVLISTHPKGRSNWLEANAVEKIQSRSALPVTHVIVDLPAEQAEQHLTTH